MFRSMTPVVRAVLYTNLIVYGLEWLTHGQILYLFALWPWDSARYGGAPFEPWQLVTYAFLHDPTSLMHIGSNMLALYMFGPDVEGVLGPRRFSVYYFVCVVGAALAQLLVQQQWLHSGGDTIGASGGIFGLLLFYALAFPRRQILVFAVVPMPAWLFVTLYGVLELFLGVSGQGQGVAHFAHLGGMAAGFVLIRYWLWQARSAAR